MFGVSLCNFASVKQTNSSKELSAYFVLWNIASLLLSSLKQNMHYYCLSNCVRWGIDKQILISAIITHFAELLLINPHVNHLPELFFFVIRIPLRSGSLVTHQQWYIAPLTACLLKEQQWFFLWIVFRSVQRSWK